MMTSAPIKDEAVADLVAALRAALPFVQASARHHERLGLGEEAQAAWGVYRRARWALDRAAPGPSGADLEYQD